MMQNIPIFLVIGPFCLRNKADQRFYSYFWLQSWWTTRNGKFTPFVDWLPYGRSYGVIQMAVEGGNWRRSCGVATCLLCHWRGFLMDVLISFFACGFSSCVPKMWFFFECGLQCQNALRSLVWQGTRRVKGVKDDCDPKCVTFFKLT